MLEEVIAALAPFPTVLCQVIGGYLEFSGTCTSLTSCEMFPTLPLDCLVLGSQFVVCFELARDTRGNITEFRGFDRRTFRQIWSVKSDRYPFEGGIWTWEATDQVIFASNPSYSEQPKLQCISLPHPKEVSNWLGGFFTRPSRAPVFRDPEIIHMFLPRETTSSIICCVYDPKCADPHRSVWFLDVKGDIKRKICLARTSEAYNADVWDWWGLPVEVDDSFIYINHWTGIRVYSQKDGGLIRVMRKSWDNNGFTPSPNPFKMVGNYIILWNASSITWSKPRRNAEFHPDCITLYVLNKSDATVHGRCVVPLQDDRIQQTISSESRKAHYTFDLRFLHLYPFLIASEHVEKVEVLLPIVSQLCSYH